MRTPPRRASRNSGSGFGKRIKIAKKPFSPEPAEKKRKENKSASASSRDGDGDGKKSRRGRATGQGRRRNGKAKDDEPVNKVRRTAREHVDLIHLSSADASPPPPASPFSRTGATNAWTSRRIPNNANNYNLTLPVSPSPPFAQYGVCRNRIHAQLSTIRREQHHIDAYEMDGWKGARFAPRLPNHNPRLIIYRLP
tara:strand:+ start:1101 stop:1688 length:588 start_codon:yes stop_codon:yes gene_type:complete